MKYLFCFGYERPDEYESNIINGTDYESSNGVWITAKNKEVAMMRGIQYATEYVNTLFMTNKNVENYKWDKNNYAHWIEDEPLKKWSGLALETFDEIIA